MRAARSSFGLAPSSSRRYATTASGKHHNILVVGGGTAGLAVSAQLRAAEPGLSLAIVEPSSKHYYQPGWTMVGGGIFDKHDTERNEADLIPQGAEWIQSKVATFEPENNSVTTSDNQKLTYDWLVVCPGIQINWNKIKGLEDSLGKNGVASNYSFAHVHKTFEFIKGFPRNGRAVFTHPASPVKCAGAPQKIMYLAEDKWKQDHKKPEIEFYSGGPAIFGAPAYAEVLTRICKQRKIHTTFKHDLVEVQGDNKKAVFKNLDNQQLVTVDYDFLHVTPHMGPPDFVKASPLADAAGWVDVNKETTRHNKFGNVFSLGDASSMPTSKTAAAVATQSGVLTANLRAAIAGKQDLPKRYDGYTSCPLVTGYGKLVLAEFDYTLNRKETFPIDQRVERESMYLLKKHVLPKLYWSGLIKGSWRGPEQLRNPLN